MVWMKWLIVLFLVLGLSWVGLVLFGQWRWKSRIADLVSTLNAAEIALQVNHYEPSMLEGLPAPVARYLRAVLTPGQPMVTSLRMTHEGWFNIGETTDSWKPFTSKQVVVTLRPGFVWDGQIAAMPGVPIRVLDAYVAGEGILVPSVFGLWELTEVRGRDAIASGELLRYLAESPWYPTALLPGNGVVWSPIDDHSALATITDGASAVSLTFRFGSDSLVTEVEAEARGRTLSGEIVPTPWQGKWSNYARQNDMLVPMTGEVAWLLPSEAKPYWRGAVTSYAYNSVN